MKIGVDLGGTKIRVGIVEPGFGVRRMATESCLSNGSKTDVLDQIINMVDAFFDATVDGIGVGVPAIVDDEGVVYDCVNIPSWDRVELKAALESRFGVPVKVNNDCNCFALGVKASEIVKGLDDIVCITLGTGVGSGLILGGRLYTGHNCSAGEIGGIPYKDHDYEFYCSSRFFHDKGVSGKAAFESAKAGDPEALRLWDEFGANVGDLLSLTAFAYDPQAVVIGGSIASAFQYFEPAMRAQFSKFPYAKVAESLKVIPASEDGWLIIGSVL